MKVTPPPEQAKKHHHHTKQKPVEMKKDEKTNGVPTKDESLPSAPLAPLAFSNEGLTDFSQLKLIEKPDSPLNRQWLPQTLEDCEKYLQALPLVQPNADQKNPLSIVNMINILASPTTEPILENAIGFDENSEFVLSPEEYKARQLQAYNPNAQPMQGLLANARKRTSHHKAPINLGHVVRPGCISVYSKHGIKYGAPEGRWYLPNPLAHWELRNVSLDQDFIESPDHQLMIVRVIEGQIGLITAQGVHKILDVGTHVFNSGTIKFHGTINYARKAYLCHGPYHYVNVHRGLYAKVWAEVIKDGVKSLVPRILKEGEHFIKSSNFTHSGTVKVSDEYIEHGAVHLLNVLKGHCAKVLHNNIPRLLGEGEHIIESPNFEFKGMESLLTNKCIAHGTITILQVPRGEIALAWNKNDPYFIDCPGIYEFNSEDFKVVEFKDANERQIELGAKKVVQVYTGEVGITYDAGELKILPNGRHVIDSSTHIFERFLSTKQRSIRLVSYGASEKFAPRESKGKSMLKSKMQWEDSNFGLVAEEADMLVCETKDLVKVGVRADVFYSIADPEKCIRTLDTDELEDLVRETAVATLTNIIRSTALNQIAQSKQVSAGAEPELLIATQQEEEQEEGEQVNQAIALFFDRAHDEFMSKLHEDFYSRYGVDIANIRMEAFKIMDQSLAQQISQHVLTTAQTENELANLEGLSLIATQKERTAADVQNINAESEARSLKTRTDAENKRQLDAATAQAEALKIKTLAQAESEAQAILTKAKAESEAIRLKAAAESERAKLLSQTMLGQQQSLLTIYTDMVKTSNEGVEKVIYLDGSVNRESPFALGSLDGLNRDLHSLTKLGIAANENGNGHGKN